LRLDLLARRFRLFVISWLIPSVIAMAQTGAAPRVLDTGDRSQIISARQVVARTPAEWNELWRVHKPARPLAAVDFSKEMVVAVFLGTKPTAGYGVTIVSAVEEGGAVRVKYRETSPPVDAITAQVITYPFQIVAVPKSAATEVTFEKVK
jgi:protease stability complex PrcB-like protein